LNCTKNVYVCKHIKDKEVIKMLDFSPLHKTLKDKGMRMSDLRDEVLSSRTLAKINRNEDVYISTVEKICLHLNVPIEAVVRFTPDGSKSK
jgi:DNA-binding Xre family transcriptional regulator